MRKVTATEKYRAVNEGQMPQAEFVRQMRLAFPQHITQFNGYEDTVSILKTRGVLSETKLAKQLPNTVSIDSIQRAVDIELTAAGHDPVTCSDVEAQDKAKEKALKNLKKDPLHYYNLLAKESSKVDKNDKMKETKPGAKEKDTFNDMKKAELKEDVDATLDPYEDKKEVVRQVIDLVKREKSVPTSIAVDFVKTHYEDIINMRDDQAILDEFEEFFSVNYETGSDYNEAKGMKEAFKPGDMFSTDFDYAGMLKFGLSLDDNTPVETLQALYDSFEDVNYHSENQYLGHAIDALKSGDRGEYKHMLNKFKKAVAVTVKSVIDEGGRNFVREDEKEYLEKRDKAIKGAMGKEEEETVDEGFNDHLSAEDLSDLAQFFYSYAISTEMDGYTDVAKHIDQAARELGGIESPATAPGMEENLNERVGGLQEFISLIQDRAAENDTSEKEEAEEVMYAIGDHYNIGVDIMQGPWDDEVDEAKGKDHDGDGDIDKDDYMAAKDKAIKKAMNENIKAIVAKVLEDGVVNEAATAELSRIADDYAGFDGMKSAIIALENIVTDIEQYYEKTRTKIQKVYDTLGEIRNEEGLKVGGFIAPAIEQAFLKDLRPVTKTGFTKGLDQPKVRTISQADIDAHNSGERPLGEEAPKETVFTPVMETKKKK